MCVHCLPAGEIARSSQADSCQVELAKQEPALAIGPTPSFAPAPAPGFASLFAPAHAPATAPGPDIFFLLHLLLFLIFLLY